MDIAHILLGIPWLFAKSVKHFGRTNTYVFEHDGKRIRLCPSKSKNTPSVKTSTPQASIEPRKPLHILNKKKFERERKEEKIIYLLVATELKEPPKKPTEENL